ncbi:AraC family transcriptional regulator [Xylanibacillus composti]|uniref:HTH araC/xylS-type domain-containing protein n=1 Tax=Xylanibacillus composti TaxID=1572762 RepID=A0A8J4H4I8_9BACL|nr:AraC family transcriptional regulator [Xylanibacillus composti]GIQ68754.1 hypothetical protein XYCOK13_15780 [Xylanibacillus composti]
MIVLEFKQLEDILVPGTATIRIPESPDHAFALVIRESVEVVLAGQPAGRVAAGELFYIPPLSDTAIVNAHDTPASLAWLRFAWREGSEQVCTSDDPRLLAFRLPQAQLWLEDFRRSADEPADELKRHSRLYAIAAACFEYVHTRDKGADVPDLLYYVEQTKQYILEHYASQIDIDQLARQSGGSASRFYQLFRRQTGLSPHKYITAVRLTASLRLLNSGSLSISEAAHAVGYQDEYYFSRLFKKNMGLAPSEYIVRSRRRVANLSPVFTGDLAVLGVTPVLSLERGWSRKLRESLPAITDSKPDIILTSPIPKELQDRLEEIAPVQVLYWKMLSWKERLLKISEFLELEPVAKYWLVNFDQKAEAARFHIREQLGGEPFLLIGVMPDGFRVYSKQTDQVQDLFYSGLQGQTEHPLHAYSYLEICRLEEAAALGCEHAVFLVSASTNDAACKRLEEQWRSALGGSLQAKSLFVHHGERLLYNAAIHEKVVESAVKELSYRAH